MTIRTHPGVGQRIAHDPGDPLITSHCPFCGSGQVVGRSDGTIMCDFCGQAYIVRVQPAFPGTPQMPTGPGGPSDTGPDGDLMDPGMVGPDGDVPPGADGGMGGEIPPDDAGGDDAGLPDGGGGPPPPAAGGDSDDSGSPGGKSKKLPKSKKESAYRGLGGEEFTEDQFIRHLAATLSGGHPAVMAALRADAHRKQGHAGGLVPLNTAEDYRQHLQSAHGVGALPGDVNVLRHVHDYDHSQRDVDAQGRIDPYADVSGGARGPVYAGRGRHPFG